MLGSGRAALAADKPLARIPRGFSYHHDEIPEKPWSIHVVRIDRTNSALELQTTLGHGDKFGLATLSDQIKGMAPELGHAVAGINGDYYQREYPYMGDPKGLQILHGELVSGPCDWTCFWADGAGNPHMTNVVSRFEVIWPTGQKTPMMLNEEQGRTGAVLYTAAVGSSTHTSGGRELVLERNGTNHWLPLQAGQTYSARVRQVRDSGDTPLTKEIMVLSLARPALTRAPKIEAGSVLQISTATWPDLGGAQTGIGGGPPLLRGGEIIDLHEARVRHPRAAIGWNRTHFFLVEVDGRQRNLSVGMTSPELAAYLKKLGCSEAMSLDGGGSATCWVYGQVVNSPSEGRERPMANALVVVEKEKK